MMEGVFRMSVSLKIVLGDVGYQDIVGLEGYQISIHDELVGLKDNAVDLGLVQERHAVYKVYGETRSQVPASLIV